MKITSILHEVMTPRQNFRTSAIEDESLAKAKFPVIEYLKLTASDSDMRSIMNRARTLDQYKAYYKDNRGDVPQFLVVDLETGRVTGHEGRHRAWAIYLEHGEKATMDVFIKFRTSTSRYIVKDEWYDKTERRHKQRKLSMEDIPDYWVTQGTNRGYDARSIKRRMKIIK